MYHTALCEEDHQVGINAAMSKLIRGFLSRAEFLSVLNKRTDVSISGR